MLVLRAELDPETSDAQVIVKLTTSDAQVIMKLTNPEGIKATKRELDSAQLNDAVGIFDEDDLNTQSVNRDTKVIKKSSLSGALRYEQQPTTTTTTTTTTTRTTATTATTPTTTTTATTTTTTTTTAR